MPSARFDELSLDLLAMQQPMAVDLRFILAVLKINADLERVGDQAVNIAQRVLDLISERKWKLPVDIPACRGVSTMVQRALESFPGRQSGSGRGGPYRWMASWTG